MKLPWLGCLLACVLAIMVCANSAMAHSVGVSTSSRAHGPNCGKSGICLTLAARATVVPHGSTVVLVANATKDVGPTPYYIDIVDMTNMVVVGSCASGFNCFASVSSAVAGSTYTYLAILSISPVKVINWDSWSNQVAVTWV